MIYQIKINGSVERGLNNTQLEYFIKELEPKSFITYHKKMRYKFGFFDCNFTCLKEDFKKFASNEINDDFKILIKKCYGIKTY